MYPIEQVLMYLGIFAVILFGLFVLGGFIFEDNFIKRAWKKRKASRIEKQKAQERKRYIQELRKLGPPGEMPEEALNELIRAGQISLRFLDKQKGRGRSKRQSST